jgi:arylsulfatase A-like enzyme
MRTDRLRIGLAAFGLGALGFAAGAAALPTPAMARNVVLFVADGLRPGVVDEFTAPTMDALMKRGVRFANPHSLFPTFTTANASGLATGHLLGDTGDFSNTIYSGFAVPSAADSVTPFLENDAVLGDMDAHFGGDYLNQPTVMRAAREAGMSTAIVGKVGPVLIFDHTERSGTRTLVIDDQTGRPGGIPVSDELKAALDRAGLPAQAPTRGENGKAGNNTTPGTLTANVDQQTYFANVAADVVLPMFKNRGKPFYLVFWSRDPDGTQHNQGDSLGRLVPGIGGPTSFMAIRNADNDLAKLLDTLKRLGLDQDTDVILTADHGFSVISKESATSYAASQTYKDVNAKLLPPGFVAIDLAHALGMKLYDPDAKAAEIGDGAYTSKGNGLIGTDPAHPDLVVAANGGSDLVYLPKADRALAAKAVAALAKQDYISGLFVDDALGPIPGTLPLSAMGFKGSAVTPVPSIVVNFRTFALGCAEPENCGVQVADTGLQQGQGMHGSFSRADTRNVMAAAGPSFRQHFTDPAPTSNADVGRTIAHLLGVRVPSKGKLTGRVMTEALTNGQPVKAESFTERSQPDQSGLVTVLIGQKVGETRYYDAAGYPGRTIGIPPAPVAAR